MKKDIINNLTDKELTFGNEEFIMSSDIENDEKERILDNTFTKISSSKKSKKMPLYLKITAIAAAIAIFITAGILCYGYFGKSAIQIATQKATAATAQAPTTEKEITFTPKWKKTGGFGGAGYGSFNSTVGKYVVNDFSVSDSFKLPYSGKVNVYKQTDKKTSEEDTAKIEKALLSFFDSDGIKDTESEQFKTKDDSKINIYSEYNKTASLYFSPSKIYGENFKKNYTNYSLTKLKKDGEVLANKVADSLSKATGINYIYADAVLKDDYEFFYPITDEELYLSYLSVYKFRFKTKQSIRKLNVTDSESAPIINIPESDDIKTLDEGKTQYLEIIIGPDMTLWSIQDNTIRSSFKLNETRNMFTLEQLKNYKQFSNGTTYLSNTKDDKVIFDSMDGFYYNFMDAGMSAEDDKTVAAYTLLTFHLQSNPSKSYQSGVYIDAVREGISTYDSLFSNINEIEQNNSLEYDNDPIEITSTYEVTDKSLSKNFGFKMYDDDGKIISANAPYSYTIKKNSNADKSKSIIENLFKITLKYDGTDGYSSVTKNNNAYFNYNADNGFFEYKYNKNSEQIEEYIENYKGKTMDVNSMRKTANNVAKEFSKVCGTLTLTNNSQRTICLDTGTKQYDVVGYCFEYTNSFSNYKFDNGFEKVSADFSSTVDYYCELGKFYVLVLPDNLVASIVNATTQGIVKGKKITYTKEQILDTYCESKKENDSAEFISIRSENLSAYLYSSEIQVNAILEYILKSDKANDSSDSSQMGDYFTKIILS